MPAISQILNWGCSKSMPPKTCTSRKFWFENLHSICACEERLFDILDAPCVIAKDDNGNICKQSDLFIRIASNRLLALVNNRMRANLRIFTLFELLGASRDFSKGIRERHPLPDKLGFVSHSDHHRASDGALRGSRPSACSGHPDRPGSPRRAGIPRARRRSPCTC